MDEDEDSEDQEDKGTKDGAGAEGDDDNEDGAEDENEDEDEDDGEGEDDDESEDDVEAEDDNDNDENGIVDEEDDEESDDDLALEFQADSADEENYDSELVQVVHDFVQSIVYPRARTDTTLRHTPSKWDDPIERFIAINSLQPDGNFRPARLVTQVFVIFHYHIRGAILYEGYSRLDEFEGDIYKYVSQFAFIAHNP